MRAIIDTRLSRKIGGIGTYIEELLKRLPLEQMECSAPIYSAREQLTYPVLVPKCDLFFSPHFNVPLLSIRAKKRVVTIHDVYHLDHPERFSRVKYQCAKRLYAHAVSASDLIITVSAFSKSRILSHFPGVHVEVVPLGSDHLSNIHPIEVQKIPRPFYLFVGSHKPHKNLQILQGLPLVCALGQYSPGELVWLYKRAEALIFPSTYEGFGLPLIEAMVLSCPTLASTSASIPEVCGDAALYFEPKSRKSLEEAIEKLPLAREKLVERGRQRALERSWDLCAERHNDLFAAL